MKRILEDRRLTPAERQARYRARHKAEIKARVAADKKANPKKYAAYKRTWLDRKGRAHRMLLFARARARQRGLEFDITLDDFNIPERCPVLGILLVHGSDGFNPASPTLDRIDNSRGYTKDNILVVSWRANSIKGDATPEELTMVADFYARLATKR